MEGTFGIGQMKGASEGGFEETEPFESVFRDDLFSPRTSEGDETVFRDPVGGTAIDDPVTVGEKFETAPGSENGGEQKRECDEVAEDHRLWLPPPPPNGLSPPANILIAALFLLSSTIFITSLMAEMRRI